MIVYGGFDGAAPVNDVWALDLESERWKKLRSGEHGELDLQPAPRYFHAAVFDPIGYRMIIFGGARYLTWDFPSLEDTWAFDLTDHTWERLGDGPTGRHSHAMHYMEETHSVLLFGGGAEGFQRFEDVWELHLDGGYWERLAAESLPGPLVQPEVITDADGDVILFGGLHEIQPMANTWSYCHE